MRPVITPAESARLDAASETPVQLLMDRAGYAVALAAARHGAGYGTRVVVLAGPGNNGGDGYVAARYLRRRGAAVEIQALGEPRTEAARAAAASAVAEGVPVKRMSGTGHADLVIDAVFGGGFRSGIPEEVRSWIERGGVVLAVDMPSGVDPATGAVKEGAFRAAETVAFHALKPGHLLGEGPDYCGAVTVVDIGLGGGVPELLVTEQADARRPGRRRTAHKWSAGSVLVVGGAPGMSGAAILAGRSALAFGAGAVAVATPSETRSTVAGSSPELLTHPIADVPALSPRFDAVIVGPGLGHGEASTVEGLVAGFEGLLIVDADALADRDWSVRPGPTVLTPHAGEFERISGSKLTYGTVRSFAASTKTVVVGKGNPTVVSDGTAPWVVDTGGPELATIGTGDVLAGMIAALAVRGLEPVEAARSAAFWHGIAGADLAAVECVTSVTLARHIARFGWEDGG